MAVKEKSLIILACLLLLFVNVAMFGFVLYVTHAPTTTGRAQSSGIATFCINTPPIITIPCNSTMSQNSSYFCQINLSDDQNNNVSIELLTTTIFNVSGNGTINFTPSNDDVGNHTAYFRAFDSSGCANDMALANFDFSVANVNDPPYLITDIPDKEFAANTTISAFFLTDYFADPDGDTLVFNSTTPQDITVTILTSSEVLFTSNKCDANELIRFTATDPYNATATSNNVEITVICEDDDSQGGNTGDTAGGGGGGGGGAICKSVWLCDDWFACLPTGVQWQRCYDTHGCKTEQYLKRSCTYEGPQPACKEDWLCEPWGQCHINGTQYRTCRDLERCGSIITRPPSAQFCTYDPTCNDGIKNGNETGIDCGGSCASCALVQNPSAIGVNAGLPWWLLLLIILSIMIISGVAHYYRAEIAQAIATLGFILTRKAYKDILLDAAQRKSFFERLWSFERLLQTPAGKEMKPGAVYATLSTLIRQYYVDALGVKEEVILEELTLRSKELKLRPETTMLMTGLFTKLDIIEASELEFDEPFIVATLEELRTTVCLTSDYKAEELLRPVEELVVDDKMSFYDEIFTRMANCLRAVQFNDTDAAKKEYMTILTRYDPLSEVEKEQIYPELQWIFQSVKFQSEITGIQLVKKPTSA